MFLQGVLDYFTLAPYCPTELISPDCEMFVTHLPLISHIFRPDFPRIDFSLNLNTIYLYKYTAPM